MGSYTVRLELDVDVIGPDSGDGEVTYDVERFAEIALGWLNGAARFLDAELVDELAATPKPLHDGPDDPEGPWGPPGGAVGRLSVHGQMGSGPRLNFRHRGASAAGWRWLAAQLRQPPVGADVHVNRLGDEGFPQSFIHLSISSHPLGPGWLRLYQEIASGAMTPDAQASALALLDRFADRIGPSFGQIGVDHPFGETTLEHCLPSAYGRNQPWRSIVQSRQWLRGYTWVTVLAKEHVAQLGGLQAIEPSGVFYSVTGLARGGAMLQATRDFHEYDQQKAEQVFRVLAPVLRPGLPSPPSTTHGEPYLIVYEDASAAAGTADLV